jgi:hypothetical protein
MELKTAKGRIFLFLFLVLCAPLLQQQLKLIDSGKLGGAVNGTPNPVFSWKGWWNDSFQLQKNDYLNDSMGFRQDFVRINNQIDYSLLDKTHAHGVVIGKDKYLYEDNYIQAYCGEGYPGDSVIRVRLLKLKALQDTFGKMGKQLVVAFAPSKARFYPEFFPKNMECSGKNPNLYSTHIRLCDSLGVQYINYNAWFVSMRYTSKDLLFSRQGIHWTTFGSLLAADSMIRYLEKVRHTTLSHPTWTTVSHTKSAADNDKDIIKSLNLILPIKKDVFSYAADLHYNTGKTKPNTIFIGDSFIWTWMYLNFPHNISNTWEFWYYYNEVYLSNKDGKERPTTSIKEHNRKQALLDADCIIILNTEINLSQLGNGFIEATYDLYFPHLIK